MDPLRSPARIINGRIVVVCPSCAEGLIDDDALRSLNDAEQSGQETFVTTASRPERRDTFSPPPGRLWPISGVVAAVAIAVFAVGANMLSESRSVEAASLRGNAVAVLQPRVEPATIEESELFLIEEPEFYTEGDEERWVHPIPGSENQVPTVDSRRFGAARPGDRPSECRDGHCGVDLDAPRGSPVLAVADGIILRVEHDRRKRSGLYVRIEHHSGKQTAYMHLDDIVEGLEVGHEVIAGEMIGSLGKTGIQNSAPHLHFSLEEPRDEFLRYIDPEPQLADSRIIELFDITVRAERAMSVVEDAAQ